MSKLPEKHQFLDLSDYGRSLGHLIATKLQNTSITPIHVTTMFIITGFIAIWILLNGYLITSAFLLLLKSILETNTSEQCSRMTAMSQATDNAGELLKELKLTYNRTRQAAITKEILEIVGGAEALNN